MREPLEGSALFWLDGALGDTLLAYPALTALRAWAAGRPVAAVGNPSYYAFAAQLGLIDRAIAASGAAGSALFGGALPLDLPLPETAVLFSGACLALAERTRALGVARVIAAPPRGPGTLHQSAYLVDYLRPLARPGAPWPPLTTVTISGLDASARDGGISGTHSVTAAPDPLVHTAAPPGIAPSGTRPGTYPTLSPPRGTPLEAAQRALIGPSGRPTVLLHPGAGGRWKRWPLRHFLALAEALARAGCAVRWSFGPADDDLREALLAVPRRPGELWPDLRLHDYAALLARCALLISADTGVAHLAALFDVPQVTLFGPTDPRRWRPLGARGAVIQAPDLCGGTWEAIPASLGEATGGPRLALQRCRPFDRAACACLGALPVSAALDAGLAALP